MVNLLMFSLSVGGLLRRTRESSFLVWLQQTLGHRVPFSQRRLVDPIVDKVALLTSDHNVRVPENSEMLGDRGGCDVERACQRVYAQGAVLEQLEYADSGWKRENLEDAGKLFRINHDLRAL